MAGRRVCAAQGFAASKPWRRRNSLPPSISNFHGYHKKGHTHQVWPFYGGEYWTRTSDIIFLQVNLFVLIVTLEIIEHVL